MTRRVSSLLVLLVLGSVSTAAAQRRNAYLYTRDVAFKANTGPRQTTGFRGVLFGHLSQADVTAVVSEGQRHLGQSLWAAGVDSARVSVLPIRLGNLHQAETNLGTVTTQRWLGGTRSDAVSNFKLTGTMHLAFVHDNAVDIPGFTRRTIATSRVDVKESGRMVLGEVRVPHNELNLGAFRSIAERGASAGDLSFMSVVPTRRLRTLADHVDRAPPNSQPMRNVETTLELRMTDGTRERLRLDIQPDGGLPRALRPSRLRGLRRSVTGGLRHLLRGR